MSQIPRVQRPPADGLRKLGAVESTPLPSQLLQHAFDEAKPDEPSTKEPPKEPSLRCQYHAGQVKNRVRLITASMDIRGPSSHATLDLDMLQKSSAGTALRRINPTHPHARATTQARRKLPILPDTNRPSTAQRRPQRRRCRLRNGHSG
jgi:hypothetical protein